MRVETQKTYKKQSANQWLRNARVYATQSGGFEIMTPDLPGKILVHSDYDNLVISDYHGIVVALDCGARASKKLAALTAQTEDLYRAKNADYFAN